MSHLTYHNFEGSATKRNTNTVKPYAPVTASNEPGKIDQAFANVDMNLKHAGGKGWEQVFRVDSYHIPLDDEALEAMVRNLKEYMPNHEPIWTVLGVSRLAEDDMRVEIEVVAHDPK
ncbi:L-PSP endoribonuclease family protein [Aspergillus flavus]|nr:L-PSP endoribonuclease family protein [Aspergillus flavus]RAQ76356.1 L-PSP endoribonuclease family protein [Aspergillus flavus]